MANVINATSTGNGGLVSTGDDSGILNIQTNETTAITVDASQRVAFVAGTAALPAITTTGDTNTGIFFPAADTIAFSEGGAEAMRIDSSGNVGIGTSSPAKKLDVNGDALVTQLVIRSDDSDIMWTDSGSRPLIRGNKTNNTLAFYTSSAERMRIDSSGNLLVGTTTQPVNTYRQVIAFAGGAVGGGLLFNDGDSGNTYPAVYFRKDGAQRGNINVTTSGTTYNTVSDYRLKENIAPMTGALAKVTQLKPVTYKWKSDGEEGQGFIAHELAEVEAGCVTGEKDAVDEEGNPVYQGIDTSFLVATLTAAIQELKAINDTQAETINALTARIVALESKP